MTEEKIKVCPHYYEDKDGAGFSIQLQDENKAEFRIYTTEGTYETIDGLKSFYCPLCGRKFNSSEVYFCPYCKKTFPSYIARNNHIEDCEGEYNERLRT